MGRLGVEDRLQQRAVSQEPVCKWEGVACGLSGTVCARVPLKPAKWVFLVREVSELWQGQSPAGWMPVR